jgi:hypothetical protein
MSPEQTACGAEATARGTPIAQSSIGPSALVIATRGVLISGPIRAVDLSHEVQHEELSILDASRG